jgi:hypothetical protein
MEIFNDLIYTNKKVLSKTFKTLFQSQELFVIGIPYLLIPMIVFQMAGAFSILAGMIIFATISAVISDYLFVIENILIYEKFSWDAFKVGYKVYFKRIFGTLFIFYLVNYGISLFISPVLRIIPFGSLLLILLKLSIILLINPLPEVFYQKKYDELDSLSYSVEFVKKNIVSWFVPNIVLVLVTFFAYKGIYSLIGFITVSLNNSIGLAISIIIISIFLQVLVGFALVYRGYLFKILDTSTRKKRLFKRHM